jgi:multidrug efflux pump subunit AcrA (membrane-fusion protein)
MLKNKKWIAAILIGVVALIALFFLNRKSDDIRDITVEVKRGPFEITINTSGELDAVNSVSIRGPSQLRATGLREFKVEKLIPEGTVVAPGDFIAELDKSELFNKLTDAQDQLTKEQAQYTQTQLDTALQLREARDQILNLVFAVEEKKIALEQSAFEPPATIKQAELELEKAQRDLRQARENYLIKVEQSRAKMTEASINLGKAQGNVNFMRDLLASFTITAPQDGMVIYTKQWDGRKIREGSTISSWNPVVATLPDLSKMISRTYINEVDIMKVKRGQSVNIGLDAYPDKKLTGRITAVANVGEQKPNSDAKVFEVTILINETDTALRPAMTTSNLIISDVVPDAMFIPLECLHNQGDSILYVYKKEGINTVKQEVLVGKTNENEGIILEGLAEKDVIYLTIPKGMEEAVVRRLKITSENIVTKR